MNTTVTTHPGRRDHYPPQPVETLIRPARRVGLADRLALHLGVALIAWGRRPGVLPESRERRASRVEHRLAQLAREQDCERLLLLTVPRR